MTIYETVTKMSGGELAGLALVLLIILFSLVQISPLKLNPWDSILGWIGKKTSGETREQLKELKKQVQDMWVNGHRTAILSFAREARSGIQHSESEWTNILNMAREYEIYVDKEETTMRDFSIDLIWTKVQIAITALGGWMGYFLGGMDGLMIALIVMMTLDYVSGVMCAIVDRKLSSSVGFKGICKKVFILMLAGVAHIIDLHVVGTGSALRGAVICFYMSNEGLSLLENAAHIGLPIPDKLRDILSQLHDNERTTDQGDGE